MSKYTYNKNYFEVINTKEKAYILGFLYADGCINSYYKNERLKAMTMEIQLKYDDIELLEKIKNELEANVPITTKTNKIKDKIYKSCRMIVNCTGMCRDLIKLGCTPKKSLTLTFPNEEILPIKFRNDFIRGYFDGDGCVHYSENYRESNICNSSWISKNFVVSFVGTYEFLEKLKNILYSNNIHSCDIKHGNCGKAFELRLYGFENIINFYNYIYDDSKLFLKRKFDKFNYAIEKVK